MPDHKLTEFELNQETKKTRQVQPDDDKVFSIANGLNLSPSQRRRKIRLEWGALALVAAGLLILTLVQREVIDLGPGLAGSRGVITLVSINFSVLLITLLIVLVLRQLYRIFFEKEGYGSLQTKMVVGFICLSLLPTIVIFYYSYRQLVRGHDLWFSPQIEEAMEDSIYLTEAMLTMDDRVLAGYGADLLEEYRQLPSPLNIRDLTDFLVQINRRFHLTTVEFYDPAGQLTAQGGQPGLPPINPGWFSSQLSSGPPWKIVMETASGDLTRLVWPLFLPSIQESDGPTGFLVIGRLTMAPIRSEMEDLRHFLVTYQDVLKVQRPFRVTQLTALTAMATLLVFISVWIGSHLARSLARPVTDLVNGTKRVAAGDWEFNLTPHGRSGEFMELVKAFNLMTRDLKKLYQEVDSRRRFAETVLKNVSTGVVILSTEGQPRNLNQAAINILFGETPREPDGEETSRNQAWPPGSAQDFDHPGDFTLPPPLATLIEEVLRSPRPPGRRVVEHHVRLVMGDLVLSLRAGLTTLLNEDGEIIGYLLTFDDLTELEKAQRLAAWREVARRIAHEVKNPLTPIQLSAQRLRRRFSARLSDQADVGIFEECTEVIIRQVDEMKKLMDEFSQFARLPEVKARPGNFIEFLTESLSLFRQAHKKVDFQLEVRQEPPVFSFDPEQMRRVLTNILDNAIAAMNQEGKVLLTVEIDELTGLRLSISDTGPGIDPLIMDRLFDPHVSTKEGGQGLGLAIVRTIVTDHGGFIRVKNLSGSGAKFIIDLPLR